MKRGIAAIPNRRQIKATSPNHSPSLISRPDAFNLSTIVRASSGQPFTPVITTGFNNGLETNSGRKPVGLVVDLRGEKNLRVLGLAANGFARIFNLTDTRFNNGFVFDTSGDPYHSRFPGKDYASLADPTRYYAPRRIEVGLSLRSGE